MVEWLLDWLFACLIAWFCSRRVGQSGLSFCILVRRLFVFVSYLACFLVRKVSVCCLQFYFCSVVISNRGGLELIFDWSLISSRERRRRRRREDWGKVTLNKNTVVVPNPSTLSLPPSPVSLLISTPRTFRTGSGPVSNGVLGRLVIFPPFFWNLFPLSLS